MIFCLKCPFVKKKKNSLRRLDQLLVHKFYQFCFEHEFNYFRHYFPDFCTMLSSHLLCITALIFEYNVSATVFCLFYYVKFCSPFFISDVDPMDLFWTMSPALLKISPTPCMTLEFNVVCSNPKIGP